jgi:hypothetical protein
VSTRENTVLQKTLGRILGCALLSYGSTALAFTLIQLEPPSNTITDSFTLQALLRARTAFESAAGSSLAMAIDCRPLPERTSSRRSPSLRAMPRASTSNPMRVYAAIPERRSATPMVT